MSKRLMDDEDFIRAVTEAFLGDMIEQIALLKTAVADGYCQIAAQSHKIRGSAANVGGMALSGQPLIMEHAGKADKVKTLGHVLPKLERSFTLLKEAMEKIL